MYVGPNFSKLFRELPNTVSTDDPIPPHLDLVGKNVLLVSNESYLASQSWSLESLLSPSSLGSFGLIAILLVPLGFLTRRLQKVVNRPPLVVGKILDYAGHPVEGATVEVMLESPEARYPPVQTDRDGDFIVGGSQKIALLTGKLRISRVGYTERTIDFRSPIVVETLQPKP